MEIEKIKKQLLEDKEFRNKLFELYYQDNDRFINRIFIDGEEAGKLITPSTSQNKAIF